MTPTFVHVRRIASDLFNLPDDQITPEFSPQDVENWDSVQHLNLILALEEQFAIQFEPAEIGEMHTLGQIASLLDRKIG